ncbi:MAG: hypothetical protein QG595_1404 [Pseudomonadota bacterium]|jgi:hypothetical protein|nr:hypothetical protein [Pseudomonadota bacterium]
MQRLTPASSWSALVLASALVVMPAVAQQATVYKWTDEQGVPHYSDQPPVNAESEALPIRYRRTDKAAVQARIKTDETRQGAEDLREDQEDAEEETAATQREKDLAERAATCKQARERVTNYNQAQKLYKPGPNGDRIYLTDEELDAERADAQRVMEEWCSEE